MDLRLGEDWTPLGFSTAARYEQLPASYVGYGITASSLNYDDYVGVDLTNRIAIAFAGTPDGDNPHGEFARYGELRWKATAARDRGAKALLVIAREDNFKEDRLARLSNDYTSGDAGLPVAVISRAVARRIIEAGGIATPLDESEQSLTQSAKAAASQSSKKNMSAPLSGVELKVQTEIVRTQRLAANVVGILAGSHEKLKHEAIVIGAHYDHLGRGGSGSLAAREGEIHYGADDNASGTSALSGIGSHAFVCETAPAADHHLCGFQRRRRGAHRF
ncbi:MAG: M28 family peptidase [Pyrinomonadaceae bacterium]